MPLALVTTNPLAVVTTYEATTVNINLPGIGDVLGVGAGYTSPDGAFKLVAFNHFTPPPGKIISGGLIQTVDAQFNVVEISGVTDAPNPAAISPLQFRNLFTAEERMAVAAAGLSDAQIRVWIDDCSFLGVVDLTSTEVVGGFEYLVAHNIVTQKRADEIQAFRLA